MLGTLLNWNNSCFDFFLSLILFDIHNTYSERNIIFLFYKIKKLDAPWRSILLKLLEQIAELGFK